MPQSSCQPGAIHSPRHLATVHQHARLPPSHGGAIHRIQMPAWCHSGGRGSSPLGPAGPSSQLTAIHFERNRPLASCCGWGYVMPRVFGLPRLRSGARVLHYLHIFPAGMPVLLPCRRCLPHGCALRLSAVCAVCLWPASLPPRHPPVHVMAAFLLPPCAATATSCLPLQPFRRCLAPLTPQGPGGPAQLQRVGSSPGRLR